MSHAISLETIARQSLAACGRSRAGVACVFRPRAAALLLAVYAYEYDSSSLLARGRNPLRTAARDFCHRLLALRVLILLFLLAGCQQQAPVNHSEDFAADDQPKAINRLIDAQAARGAAVDATLYADHFDGSQLNSLGTTKLDLMLKDGGPLPISVWMAVPEDDKMQMRRLTVAAYLKDKGVALDQIRFAAGPNPATGSPAAKGLKDLDKLESDSTDSGNSSSPSSADPSAMAGGGGAAASGGQSPSH